MFAAKSGYTIVGASEKGSGTMPTPYRFINVRLSMDDLDITQNIKMVRQITVSGKIKTDNGPPIYGAHITPVFSGVPSRSDKSATSDSDGSYIVEVPPFMNVRIKVEADGYAPAWSRTLKLYDKPVAGFDVYLNA